MADPISSIPGVSTGVDWKSLVDSIISADKAPATRMQAQLDAATSRKTALTALGTQLDALKTAAQAFVPATTGAGAGTASAFGSFLVTAAGTDGAGRAVVSAAAGPGASAGTYALDVTSLAAAQKVTAGAGFDASAALPTQGTFTLTRPGTNGGAAATLGTVTVGPASTLASVRDAINALNTGAAPSGVTASLVTLGAGDQRLVLTATASGAANGFALQDGGAGVVASLGLDPADPAHPPRTQAARDAQFTVDGLAVSRATNSVTDLLPGVTLTLGATGASTLEVARNGSAAAGAAQAFVDAFNKVVTTVKAQAAPSQPLYGDPLARGLQGGLASLLLTPAAGGAPDLATLGAVGISLQKDGTLSLDSSKLQSATDGRLQDAAALLADRMGAVSDFVDADTTPGTGAIAQRGAAIDDRNATLQGRIDDLNARLDKKRTTLLAQYSRYEAAIGRLQALQSTMSAQFTSLTKSSS